MPVPRASSLKNNQVCEDLACTRALKRSQKFFMLEQKELSEYGGGICKQ